MHEMMKIMPGWLPFNFKRWTAPLILNMATHRHTTESVQHFKGSYNPRFSRYFMYHNRITNYQSIDFVCVFHWEKRRSQNSALWEEIGRISALLQTGTKIVPQRALFYGPSNGALRAPFRYRLFLSQCCNLGLMRIILQRRSIDF